MNTIAPHGTWISPITADDIVSRSIGIGSSAFDGDDLYWIESRPDEGGRCVLVRRAADGTTEEITPAPFNVRTRAHEYGGGAYVADGGTVLFSNFADQRLYRVDPGREPRPLTPETQLRYADGCFDRTRNRVVIVREDHRGDGEAVNTIVAIDLDAGGEGEILAEGHDFFAAPRVSPDGTKLCWFTWDHPRMPWDGTELMLADLEDDGSVANARVVAGGPEESIVSPGWSPDGGLLFVSDRSGWWNLCRLDGEDVIPVCPLDAEFGQPHWVFGGSTWDSLGPDRIVAARTTSEGQKLGILDVSTGALEDIDLPYTVIGGVRSTPGRVAFTAASATTAPALVVLDLATLEVTEIRRSTDLTVDPAYLSAAEAVEFPTEDGLTAHAYLYRPKNGDFEGPDGELPPLLVKSHGGPTSASGPALSLAVQFWTSRGFAVLDVNYGGSTGYGREYRERLRGRWGIVDVDDCVNGALHLVREGIVDGNRTAIRGGSAGGYTTLAALAFRDVFRAGASHYGVSDLSALARDTHKFESRYLDSMIGSWPEEKALYEERSPIHHVEGLDCPVIFFQGLEDRVVPPNQAETMVAALREKGIPVAYVPFEGEQHGFRIASNIKAALEGELYFYGRVFGFDPAGELAGVPIENLD
ncbi:MAG: S9 family peptidase [Planctomycetota bacterium]